MDTNGDSQIEKRRYPRIPVRIPVTYQSSTMTIDGLAANISQEGLAFTCPSVDCEGATGEVVLLLPGQQRTLRLPGRVVWCDRAPQCCTMGIHFTPLAREHRLALANFLLVKLCCM